MTRPIELLESLITSLPLLYSTSTNFSYWHRFSISVSFCLAIPNQSAPRQNSTNTMHIIRLSICLFAIALFSGCANSRYIMKDAEYGVVAIPSNSTWPLNHREKAHELMQQHFPSGYSIEREEEVVVGSSTSSHGNLNGHVHGENSPVTSYHGSSSEFSSTRDETEWRITYRRDPNGIRAPVQQ